MISDTGKRVFRDLDMDYPAVAVKFCYYEPKGIEHFSGNLSFCQFLKVAQTEGRTFYITEENENCTGRGILGMSPRPGEYLSGEHGLELGAFKTAAPNARLHALIPTLPENSVKYVIFSPLEQCAFDPDLVICVTRVEKAEYIMRATSYRSGDLWESKFSYVVSCAWTYVYPYLTGKVNFTVTGMHLGLKRRKIYPAGLYIISIPFQKLDEVIKSLDEMKYDLVD